MAQPSLSISPARSLYAEPVSISLIGLVPDQEVILGLTSTFPHLASRWESQATFVADRSGVVDLTRDAPLRGSYDGVDPMGLFWSMRYVDQPDRQTGSPGPPVVELTAETGGEVIARTTLDRRTVADGLTVTELREHGLVGSLFWPAGDGPIPAVVCLSGSGGGMPIVQAAALSAQGFAALALAYFGTEPLPPGLVNIPLEYFESAFDWLTRQPGVAKSSVGLVGVSRGGELVLLLGATFPIVRAVVAYAPSHVVWGGFGRGAGPGSVAWTHRGQPVMPMQGSARAETAGSGQVMASTERFLSALQDKVAEARAAIPVERINGPVLLISGRDDAVWPSTLMAERVVSRLKEHGHPYPVEHLAYEGAGHLIGLPYQPVATTSVNPISKRVSHFGGNPRDGAFASADSWPRVVRFLREALG